MVPGLATDTVTWSGLMAELQQLAVAEAAQPAMSSIRTGKADKDKDTKGDKNNKNTNNTEQVDCSKCGKKTGKDYKHCGGCDHHFKGDLCWWCNPDKAPDGWKHKKEANQQKKERQSSQKSTTGPLHQQSGVANPGSSTVSDVNPCNLFFTMGHDSDDDDDVAVNMMTLSLPSFREGPQHQ